MASNPTNGKAHIVQILLLYSFAVYGCNDVSLVNQTERNLKSQDNSEIAEGAAMSEPETPEEEAEISEPVMVAGAFLTCFFNGDLSGASCLVANETTTGGDLDKMNVSAKIIVSSDKGENFTFSTKPKSSGNALRFDLSFAMKMGSMYSVSIDFGKGASALSAELDARSSESIMAATEPSDSTMTGTVNLVENGSFEYPNDPFPIKYLESIAGWDIDWSSDEDSCDDKARLEVANSLLPIYGNLRASDGLRFVELASNCPENKSAALKITQKVDTKKKHFYVLSFDWVNRWDGGYIQGLRFRAKFENLVLVHEAPKNQWQTSCFIVKARDDDSKLSFAETAHTGVHGTILDNVQLFDIDKNIAANRHLIPEGCTLKLDNT